MLFACERMGMAVLEVLEGEDGERVFRLITVRDEPAWVIATSANGWADDRAEQSISLRAKVGRFGDERRERRLVRLIADRLGDLRRRERG